MTRGTRRVTADAAGERAEGRVERVDVAIVGGGPAGAVLATYLAGRGREVMVLERSLAWHWRAGGVFTSPAAVVVLRRVGLDTATLAAVARPIPAMRVETASGTAFRLTYGADTGGEPAVGFDRSRLDPALLDRAAMAGAEIRRGWHVTGLDLDEGTLTGRRPDGGAFAVRASVIAGADGLHSIVARTAGVARPARLPPRVGLTYHLPDPDPTGCRDARMRVFRDGYVGIAPVAGGRVNVGIVLGRSWRAALAREGRRAVVDSIVADIPPTEEDSASWRDGEPTDTIEGAWPLGHRVTRRAGRGWLLVGDAAGFLDPFTGEGLHRALVSTEVAAAAIEAYARGGRNTTGAFDAYERAMQRRFRTKDVVSWLVQGFLGSPALFEYAARRLADRPGVRATMGLVMGDLVPASRALDPRYLASLLAP
jgi:flavin-dependent dehydrogenase